MFKKKLLLLMLMSGSVTMQSRDEGLLIVGAAGVAVTGIIVWRATAPSDEAVLSDVTRLMQDKNLEKYKQFFQLTSPAHLQEQELMQNIYKLGYQNQYIDAQVLIVNLKHDELELAVLRDSIWFRSFFNADVLKKYYELESHRLQVNNLITYFSYHTNFFKGWSICKDYAMYQVQLDSAHGLTHVIRKMYILDFQYPLISFVTKATQDLVWMKNLKKGMYPELERELSVLYGYVADIIVFVKNHAEYDKERLQKYQDDEEKRKQDMVNAQLLIAQAAIQQASAAAKQASVAALNAQTERERLALEKENNERARIQARVEELRRYGYTDQQIQNQLDLEGFAKALIGWAFGTK